MSIIGLILAAVAGFLLGYLTYAILQSAVNVDADVEEVVAHAEKKTLPRGLAAMFRGRGEEVVVIDTMDPYRRHHVYPFRDLMAMQMNLPEHLSQYTWLLVLDVWRREGWEGEPGQWKHVKKDKQGHPCNAKSGDEYPPRECPGCTGIKPANTPK